MTGLHWTDKLTRPVRDAVANVTLHTREDARRHIQRIAVERGLKVSSGTLS